jgi:hypothetical protein
VDRPRRGPAHGSVGLGGAVDQLRRAVTALMTSSAPLESADSSSSA